MEGRLPENIIDEYKKRAESAKRLVLDKLPKAKLLKENINNCTLLVDRKELLRNLPKDSIVAEVGVNQGEFSHQILNICKPSKLHLIDAWHSERYHDGLALLVEKKFERYIFDNRVEINRGLSTEIVERFHDGYFDWVYIDTVHDYETTKLELEKYSEKVREGGVIAGHDYSMGNWVKSYKYGVIEALHEFCVNNRWEFIFLTMDFIENQSFAIRKI
jgi:predicted O-methyltransferase YrrM